MIDNNRHIEQMLEGLEASRGLVELHGRIKGICESFDIEKFSISTFFNIGKSQKGFDFFDTYPAEWLEHYMKNQYYLYDPMFSWGKVSLPFYWKSSEMKDLTPIQKRLFSEAHDFGVEKGMALPLLPFPNEQTFVHVLDVKNLHSTILHILSLASQLYWKTKQKIDAKYLLNSLTTREREVLLLKAQGTPSRHVAEDLSISVPTVVFHLKNVRKKLNVSTSEEVLFLLGLAVGKSNQIFQNKPHEIPAFNLHSLLGV